MVNPMDIYERIKKIGTNEDAIVHYFRNLNDPDFNHNTWFTHGYITEEEIKAHLTAKQWSDWKQGKRNVFIKEVNR